MLKTMFKTTSMRTLTVGAMLLAVAFMSGCTKKVKIGKDEVIYKGTATEQEAQKLGEALKAAQYFGDNEASVILSKGTDGTIISYVVKDGFWDDQKNVEGFAELSRGVAPAVGGLPIKVRLLNTAGDTKKEIPVS